MDNTKKLLFAYQYLREKNYEKYFSFSDVGFVIVFSMY